MKMKYIAGITLGFVTLAMPHLLRGGALELDGNGDIVTFPGTGIPSGANPFTIEAWINPTTIPTGGANGGQITFWGNQTGNQANGFRLRGATGTRHFFWSNDHDENFGISILPDTTGPNGDGWHHLAITFDGAQTRWYWNGALLGTPRTVSPGVNVQPVNHRIGSRLNAEFFHGFIDELRIWSDARSSSEIQDNMGQALAGNEANLVAYWDFEGDYADRAGGNNNGTPVGDATINTSFNAPIQTEGPKITTFLAFPNPVLETGTLTFSWSVDASQVVGALTVQILDDGGGVIHTTANPVGSFPLVIPSTGEGARQETYTLRASDGGGDMVVREEDFTVTIQPLPTPPSDVLLSTASIAETTSEGGLIGVFQSVDVNPGDTHTYDFATGPGDADNDSFTISGNELLAKMDFAGRLGQGFSIRVRSTDSGGLSLEKAFTLTVTEVSSEAVINEIHFNPPDNTVRQEFIEIHNPGDAVVDLTGWRISAAVDYLFPGGTTIPPGGFLVVAEDPITLQATFGVNALGPYSGNLDADGETVRLRDAVDDVVDEVDYAVGFPWPVDSDGGGSSIELINPTLNNAHGSSWRASLPNGGLTGVPTPGAPNSVLAQNAPPSIRRVNHSPEQPASTNQTTITALVTDPDLVSSVTLEYQVVAPGAYIPSHLPHPVSGGHILNIDQPRSENPDYHDAARWTAVMMTDNGTGGDEVAGDNIYTAVLPAQAHRALVRYRIYVQDALGNAAQVPYPDDQTLNFAYFVYNGVPDYNGHSAEVLTKLPVYHVITRAQDWSECMAWNNTSLQIIQGGQDRFYYNWTGTLVYDGVVYDNIRYRLRGANGRYHQNGKRSMRFRLNDGHFLQARDQQGKKFKKTWRTLTTTKGFENRQTLTYALNEAINMYLWDKIGLPAQNTLWAHWRVIDGAEEAPDQWRGDFWGLNFIVETYDVRFLEEHDLPKGSMYKLINQTRDPAQQLRYQGAFAPASGEDHDNIELNLTGNSSESFIRAHVELEKYYLYHSLSEAIRNYDFWPDANKNMVYYFYPEYTAANGNRGRLWILPWDSDATWGPTWNNGHDVVYNSIFPASGGGADSASTPELWPEYYNAVRELRDLLWQEDQIRPLIDSFASTIADFIPADSDRWKGAPADAGNYGTLGGQGIISLEALVQDLKNFAFVGGNWPGGGVGTGGRAAHLDNLDDVRGEGSLLPATPTILYAGAPGFPLDGLVFQSSAFADPQGAGTFGAMEWRVAEIENPSAVDYQPSFRPKLEWTAAWESGLVNSFAETVQVPAVELQPGVLYRARVRHRDNTGRWSHWSAPFEFTPINVDLIGDLPTALVISEIMYNPPAAGGFHGDDLEWLELKNIGSSVLNLSGLFFSDGIDFTFANGTTLAPGQSLVLARTASAFSALHPGVTVAGEYGGKLGNGGETLTIDHPHGVRILSFTYGDRAPWPVTPDGFGFSLVRDPISGDYRASSQPGGSPGADDPASLIPTVVINEVLSASTPPAVDVIELLNTGSTQADLGGWYLTDDPDIPKKYRIPNGTTLAAGGLETFDENNFNPTPGMGSSFSLSSAGEDVYLFSADLGGQLTGYSHGFELGGSARDLTLGRYVNSVGEEQIPAQITPSLRASNVGPAVGPVVISEIQYHPKSGGLAFVELQNISDAAVPLYDPEASTNTWRLNGLGFDFPAGMIMAPGSYLLIVESDPATFRATYPVPPSVPIFGPYPGGLQNDGERLRLQRPSTPDTNGFYYITVDGVRYDDKSPWPTAADGNGPSLQRVAAEQYGDDPINWDVALPSPGEGIPSGEIPVVTQQPEGGTLVAFQDIALQVEAMGSEPLFYQWRWQGSPLDGATNTTLLLSNLLLSQAGSYDVVVYNRAGAVVSDPAFVQVLIPANFVRQPQDQVARLGEEVTFSVSATSTTPVHFQWRFNGVDIQGATSSVLTLPGVTGSDRGFYDVVATDAAGPVVSRAAYLEVLVPPVVQQPLSPVFVNATAGSDVTFSLEVNQDATMPVYFRWLRGFSPLVPSGVLELNSHQCILTVSNIQPSILFGSTNIIVSISNAAFFPTLLDTHTNAYLTVFADSDGDGMSDEFEDQYASLDRTDPEDGDLDADGDGSSNRDEHIAGTDPEDPSSYLRIDDVVKNDRTELEFLAKAGRSYSLLYADEIHGGGTSIFCLTEPCPDGVGQSGVTVWRLLTNVVAVAEDRLVKVTDEETVPGRYYQLRIPAEPLQ